MDEMQATAATTYRVYETRYSPRYGIFAAVNNSALCAVTPPFIEDGEKAEKLAAQLNAERTPLTQFKMQFLCGTLSSFFDHMH